ncbi:MAG: aminotransferase class III-fold pyridoxal phosphate-dependent enzyme [Firmicutes bacterium]|nr:aminotransferase class III-fold pyridoxal phosphate-dependent enzyme [Bacillota bacterium]
MKTIQEIIDYDLLAPVSNFNRRELVSSTGAAYTDREGNEYIDLNEMCIVLGQKNQGFSSAMKQALDGFTNHKTGFSSAKEDLYRCLDKTTKGNFKAVHLMTSGSEAIEWAVTLAKKMTGRSEIISFWNSIHGRTYLSRSMSGLPRRKAGLGALPPGVVLTPYPRCAHCEQKEKCTGGCYPCLEFTKQQYRYGTAQDGACVIIEPFQGACIDIPEPGYFQALYKWAKEQGMLFILDENQSCCGRAGDYYNFERLGIVPDILVLGKGLGNGFHISAILLKELPEKEVLPSLAGGVGDDTLCCAAAAQVFHQLEDGLLEHINKVGAVMKESLLPLKNSDRVLDVRTIGLAGAIEYKKADDCTAVYKALSSEGFFVGHVENCITLKPPYVITADQLQRFAQAVIRITDQL